MRGRDLLLDGPTLLGDKDFQTNAVSLGRGVEPSGWPGLGREGLLAGLR